MADSKKKITELNRKQIYHFPGFVQHIVDVFLTDSVVTTSIVVSSVFLACEKLVRVKQLSVGPSTNLIYKPSKKKVMRGRGSSTALNHVLLVKSNPSSQGARISNSPRLL